MRKFLYTLFTLCLGTGLFAQSATLSGKVVDSSTGEALIGASVTIENTNLGTATDVSGIYRITGIEAGSYKVVVSYLGYNAMTKEVSLSGSEDVTLDFSLEAGIVLGDEVVVSGSYRTEKLTESPATIETIYSDEILSYAGSAGELLARQKGLDYFRAGVTGTGINVRGFNSNFNAKNLQMTDGRLSTLIATGLPFGQLNTTVKEDIERVEVILGPNAVLFGPNAHNGLLHTITKDPRKSAGTMITVGAGNQSVLSARLRHAQVLNDKFSFKVMVDYTQGEEFDWADSVYINRDGEPGNEAYEEFQLDNSFDFLRTELALYYAVNNTSDIIFNWGRSNSTFLSPTNVGRNQINDWKINYYQLRYKSPRFFAQVYYTTSATDSTYAIDERTKQYYRGIDAGLSESAAAGSFSYQSGALFQDDSRRLNAEVQYNNNWGDFDLITGVQYQRDMANSLGSYLLDEDEDDFITVDQVGAYAHLTYSFGDGWKALGAARADNHEYYGFNFVPKFGVLKVGDRGTWRLTYGQGIAAPTILNMFGNLFSGLILGNAEGFTLADGTIVDRQRVEKLQTIELGYRGQIQQNKLFLDANAYYNISKDFLSPLKVIGVAEKRGDENVADIQDGFAIYNGLVASYVNFGKFDTYGIDIGLNYYINNNWNIAANYSYFGYNIDEDNVEDNDFDGNGIVDELDLLVNAPNHKANLALNYTGSKFFGTIFARWVEAYNYFSSFQIASETLPGKTYRGVPIVEGARSADSFNYGPLGGFVTVDLNLGYKISQTFSVMASVTNLFDEELFEFTAAPPTRRLYGLEVRVNLPAITSRN